MWEQDGHEPLAASRPNVKGSTGERELSGEAVEALLVIDDDGGGSDMPTWATGKKGG